MGINHVLVLLVGLYFLYKKFQTAAVSLEQHLLHIQSRTPATADTRRLDRRAGETGP